MKRNIIIGCIIVLLIAGNIATGYELYKINAEVASYQHIVMLQETNTQVITFTKLVIEKVLKANGPIDFDTRLELENAVRSLNDPQILNQWDAFVNSTDNTQAQTEMKNLLDLLIQKINLVS